LGNKIRPSKYKQDIWKQSKHKTKDKQEVSKLKDAMYNRVKNELPELDKLA
jgi:hypothetical protein